MDRMMSLIFQAGRRFIAACSASFGCVGDSELKLEARSLSLLLRFAPQQLQPAANGLGRRGLSLSRLLGIFQDYNHILVCTLAAHLDQLFSARVYSSQSIL